VSQSPKAGVFDGTIQKFKSRSVNNIVNFFALYIELCLFVAGSAGDESERTRWWSHVLRR